MICHDQKFMSYAINLAKKNLGITAPNPCVGCVIVQDNKIIASGITQNTGRPHAEIIAINKVKDKKQLIGATIYVTLEPCCHFGKTTPCVDEIIKHQFKKVVIATKDPDSRVNGQSITKLKAAKIEVICDILKKEAQELNRAFFKARLHKRPFVTLKLATSLDGKIATKTFDSKWITSNKARVFGHHLRALNDAIVIGSNTLRQDNPKLDCRILGLSKYSPQIIVIGNNINFENNLNIFHNNKNQPIILSSNNQEVQNAKVIQCLSDNKKINLEDALTKLCQNGINSILVEGGQNIATQFLRDNLVDELILIRSPKIIGDDGIAAIGNFNYQNINEVLDKFQRQEIIQLEQDLIEIYRM